VSFYDFLVYASLILWCLFGTGLIVSLLLIVPKILRAFAELDRFADLFANRMLPIMERVDGAAQDISKITDAAMSGVERLDETVDHVTDSVDRMLGIAEDRVSEANALVSVALEEAEQTFLSTAGLLSAVRDGFGSRERKKRKRRRKRRRKDRWLLGGS
jgi:methyl-accepting chemotaxis protein